MDLSRWFNPNQTQTLRLAQGLLYLNAVFGLLGAVTGGFGLLSLLLIAGYLFGGYGIANSRKAGYRVAVTVAVVALALTALLAILVSGYIAHGFGVTIVLTLVFQIGLVAALLHPQSREYQRIWFK
jgi:hypothetical protein